MRSSRCGKQWSSAEVPLYPFVGLGHKGVRHRFMKHRIWKFSLVMICHVKICQDPSPGPHYLPRATERSETVSGSASCSASPMPKSLGKLPRRRAPPCHRDLDPKMCCPRGPLTEATLAEPLMLCGPSELSGLQRRRKYLQIDQIVEQKRPKVPAQLAMEEMLRLKLRLFDEKLGGGMLKAMVGRRDLAQHILSFVNAERPLVDTAVGGKMFADSGSANVDLFLSFCAFHAFLKGQAIRESSTGRNAGKSLGGESWSLLKANLLDWFREGGQAR